MLILRTISLKYFNLIFEKDSFQIEYKFSYIKHIIDEKMKEIDTKDYFEKKKYNENESYSSLKGPFFE